MSKNNNQINTSASIKTLKQMATDKNQESVVSNATLNTTPKKEVAPFTDKDAVKHVSITPSVEATNNVVPKKKKFNICPMGAVDVKNTNLYKGKGIGFIKKVTGRLFLYDGVNYNGFYKVCKNINDCNSKDEKIVIGFIAAEVVE